MNRCRSDYCSDYKRQKIKFRTGIATNVATTEFKVQKKLDYMRCTKRRQETQAAFQAFLAAQEKRKHRVLVPKRSLQGEPCPQCRLQAED